MRAGTGKEGTGGEGTGGEATGERLGAALEGGCTCGRIRYRLTERPLFVHCCHCNWCQRETGSAFALNAMIEVDRVVLLAGVVDRVATPSASGKGQTIARCPECQVAVWSHYAGAGEAVAFVRVGTLDTPAACPPDIHIFTSTRLPWVALEDGRPVMEEYYRRSEHWPAASLDRWRALKG
ncbi:GFA family protein [Acidimangrovimonas sediminis]|uniref:GFA family protein n=1 Tax=Acidimangrovimonas sediminis TaxID=2056283 RepID=UPI000C7F921D|nr:GFA family protein [Acidimangrovimonas sediminis]